jgi:alpha-tubulin suppressor-like RCC1 family protein
VLTTLEEVWCWGDNSQDQIGPTSPATPGDPVPFELSAVAEIGAGDLHTCMSDWSGGFHCLGANTEGQLGDGTTSPSDTPREVERPADLPVEDDLIGVAVGPRHTCAVSTMGSVYCWGDNGFGQAGQSLMDEEVLAPTLVDGLPPMVVRVGAGRSHTCAVTAADDVWCWGRNDALQLGVAGPGGPIPVEASLVIEAVDAISELAVGGDHACVVTDETRAFCWGKNDVGQVGNGAIEPAGAPPALVDVEGLEDVAAGERHTCANTWDGIMWCWGDATFGQVGIVDTVDNATEDPRMTGYDGVDETYAGDSFTCYRGVDTRLRCFGRNDKGQLGVAAPAMTAEPIDPVFACP